MIDKIIDETIFIVKNLDDKLQKIADKQRKIDEKLDEIDHIKTKMRNKLFPVSNIEIK